jgi:hypothetical protein
MLWAINLVFDIKDYFKEKDWGYPNLRIEHDNRGVVLKFGDPDIKEMEVFEKDNISATFRVATHPKEGFVEETETFSDDPTRLEELFKHMQINGAYRNSKELIW